MRSKFLKQCFFPLKPDDKYAYFIAKDSQI